MVSIISNSKCEHRCLVMVNPGQNVPSVVSRSLKMVRGVMHWLNSNRNDGHRQWSVMDMDQSITLLPARSDSPIGNLIVSC